MVTMVNLSYVIFYILQKLGMMVYTYCFKYSVGLSRIIISKHSLDSLERPYQRKKSCSSVVSIYSSWTRLGLNFFFKKVCVYVCV